jgi:hypothetical protein
VEERATASNPPDRGPASAAESACGGSLVEADGRCCERGTVGGKDSGECAGRAGRCERHGQCDWICFHYREQNTGDGDQGQSQLRLPPSRFSAKEGRTKLTCNPQPKWGFLPSARYLQPPESVDIKTHHCRFCMHEGLRRPESGGGARYCPLDLYSGDPMRMRKALDALWGAWRESGGANNNWRVFVDGKVVLPEDVSWDRTMVQSSPVRWLLSAHTMTGRSHSSRGRRATLIHDQPFRLATSPVVGRSRTRPDSPVHTRSHGHL